jgi:hypothetical protein
MPSHGHFTSSSLPKYALVKGQSEALCGVSTQAEPRACGIAGPPSSREQLAEDSKPALGKGR